MKIVLAWEHVRRLSGAHSEIVTDLGTHLAARGHDVTVICDSVTDPALFPSLRFIARRTHQVGESHRLTLLARWSRGVLRREAHDVSLSFFPAIQGDLILPLTGLIGHRLRNENRALRSLARNIAIQAHYNVLERRWHERTLTAAEARGGLLAFSPHMEQALGGGEGIRIVPYAPLLRSNTSEREAERARVRGALGLSDSDRVYLWAAKHGLWHNRAGALTGFAQFVRDWQKARDESGTARIQVTAATHSRPILIVAGDSPWPAHVQACQSEIHDHMRMLGRTGDVQSLIMAADVIVNPAHHSLLGRLTYESLALGRPVIISNQTGGVDLVRGVGGSAAPGRIVDPSDSGAIARALAEFLDAGRLREATVAAEAVGATLRYESFVDAVEAALIRAAEERRDRLAATRKESQSYSERDFQPSSR